nr:MAG TPA: hypothetical protein [Caudoviricetes sp.]
MVGRSQTSRIKRRGAALEPQAAAPLPAYQAGNNNL